MNRAEEMYGGTTKLRAIIVLPKIQRDDFDIGYEVVFDLIQREAYFRNRNEVGKYFRKSQ